MGILGALGTVAKTIGGGPLAAMGVDLPFTNILGKAADKTLRQLEKDLKTPEPKTDSYAEFARKMEEYERRNYDYYS